ncbi:MAG: GntP family permease [Acetobacteraceae bacterium]
MSETIGLVGILAGLIFLVGLVFRGWTILILAPGAALIAALANREPLLAHWTQTFMIGAGHFVAQFFPLFLLGAIFGKLMEDSGSVKAVARFLSERLGAQRAILAVVIISAVVTYGGVSLMVAFFVIAPMAQPLFREANIPRRLMPAAIGLGTFTFTMSALPGSPALQNAIPMPFFGTTPFAAPGLGIIASIIMLGFGLWWLARAEADARAAGEGYELAERIAVDTVAGDPLLRERTTATREFDPAEINRGEPSRGVPPFALAALPLGVVLVANLVISFAVLPHMEAAFLAEPEFGGTSLAAIGGVWSVLIALFAGIITVVALNFGRLRNVRASVDAGANASVLPLIGIASLVGFGSVVAALPAFAVVTKWVLGIGGGPLVSLAVSVNLLAALTGSASGGMTIALDALGPTYMHLAELHGISPGLLHRVAVMASGTLDALPHNGAVVALLSVCGVSHGKSYGTMVMTVILGPILALITVVVLGSLVGSF